MAESILDRKAGVVVLPAVLLVVVALFAGQFLVLDANLEAAGYEGPLENGAAPGDGDNGGTTILEASVPSISEYASEASPVEHIFDITGVPVTVSATLQWSDEPASDPLLTNQPDTFQMKFISPAGREVSSQPASNQIGGGGNLEFTIPANANETGTWTVVVEATFCGDQEGLLRTVADSGNDYTLLIEYTYLEES